MSNQQIVDNAEPRLHICGHRKDNPIKIKMPKNFKYHTDPERDFKTYVNEAYLYEGDPDNCDLERMNNKYLKLQETLTPFATRMYYVWNAKTSRGRNMIMTSDNDMVLWHVNTMSSWSSNDLNINKRYIKFSKWIAMSDEERKKFYDEAISQ